jgi:hypothetical protein
VSAWAVTESTMLIAVRCMKGFKDVDQKRSSDSSSSSREVAFSFVLAGHAMQGASCSSYTSRHSTLHLRRCRSACEVSL